MIEEGLYGDRLRQMKCALVGNMKQSLQEACDLRKVNQTQQLKIDTQQLSCSHKFGSC